VSRITTSEPNPIIVLRNDDEFRIIQHVPPPNICSSPPRRLGPLACPPPPGGGDRPRVALARQALRSRAGAFPGAGRPGADAPTHRRPSGEHEKQSGSVDLEAVCKS